MNNFNLIQYVRQYKQIIEPRRTLQAFNLKIQLMQQYYGNLWIEKAALQKKAAFQH